MLLVMEEMATDLFHALKSVDSPFTWRGGRGQEVVLGIAQGLAYLHWRKVIHFDLKSGEPKLCPFATHITPSFNSKGWLQVVRTDLLCQFHSEVGLNPPGFCPNLLCRASRVSLMKRSWHRLLA